MRTIKVTGKGKMRQFIYTISVGMAYTISGTLALY